MSTFSLKSIGPLMDSSGDPLISIKALAYRIRWNKGWQGVGPLSCRALLNTQNTNSLKSALQRTGSNITGLKQAYKHLGYPLTGGITRLPNEDISVKDINKRIQPSLQLKFLSYNTYLLPGVQVKFDKWLDEVVGWDALSFFGIPLGGALLSALGLIPIPGLVLTIILEEAGYTPSSVIRKLTDNELTVSKDAKPALETRATLLGKIVSKYDVCCLCEVFTDDSRQQIKDALNSATAYYSQGPDESGPYIMQGSGLFFVSKNRIMKTERLIFRDRGQRHMDSDAWSNKGILLNVIQTGIGPLEIFQTHFYYGKGLKGGSIPEPLATLFEFAGVRDPTEEERMAVWRNELNELKDFFNLHHQQENVAIITGDFNLAGGNVKQYAEIRNVMDAIGMQDVWAWDVYGNYLSEGRTSRYTDGEMDTWIRNFNNECVYRMDPKGEYCDETVIMKPTQDGAARYDFIFLSRPLTQHRIRMEVSRALRRPFRAGDIGELEEAVSDHCGLDINLFFSQR